MEFMRPSANFARVYSNKTKEVNYLRTDDIPGAKPKRFIYEKKSLVEEYQNNLRNRPNLDFDNPKRNPLGYMEKVQDRSKQDDYNYELPQELRGDNYRSPSKDYNSRNNIYDDSSKNQLVPPLSIQQKNFNASPQYNLRNPLYPQVENKSNSSNLFKPAPKEIVGRSIEVGDSLDQLKLQYDSQHQRSLSVKNSNQIQGNDGLKDSWLKFYAVTPQQQQERSGNSYKASRDNNIPNRRGSSIELGGNQNYNSIDNQLQDNPEFQKLHRNIVLSNNESDDHLWEKNRAAFYRGYTPTEESRKGKGLGNSFEKKKTTNIFGQEQRNLNLYDPIKQQPVVINYQAQPRRNQQVKVDTISSQWKFNENASKFFS